MHRYWRTTLAALCVAVLPWTATAATETIEPIPTMLVATDDPIDYPDPICSKCKIIVIEDEGASTSRADILVSYPTDTPGFEGRVEVTVALEGNELRTVVLDGVTLEPGDEEQLVADAGLGWSWDRVGFVWLRFVPE